MFLTQTNTNLEMLSYVNRFIIFQFKKTKEKKNKMFVIYLFVCCTENKHNTENRSNPFST